MLALLRLADYWTLVLKIITHDRLAYISGVRHSEYVSMKLNYRSKHDSAPESLDGKRLASAN